MPLMTLVVLPFYYARGERIDYALATDCYASETSWVLSDSATGAILFSGIPITMLLVHEIL